MKYAPLGKYKYKKRVCAVKKFCITKFFFSSELSIARGWNSPVVSLCKFDVLNSTEAKLRYS